MSLPLSVRAESGVRLIPSRPVDIVSVQKPTGDGKVAAGVQRNTKREEPRSEKRAYF